MDVWTWAWVAWIAAFFAIEIPAVRNDTKGDTLSEHIRYWFRVDTHHGRTLFLVVTGVFMSWFIVHIAT